MDKGQIKMKIEKRDTFDKNISRVIYFARIKFINDI